jgi:glycosyltransferase involved in cell wall biosynthesis
MPKHHPLVSVITPAKDASVYLMRAIHSALTQVYQNFEVIVVITDN